MYHAPTSSLQITLLSPFNLPKAKTILATIHKFNIFFALIILFLYIIDIKIIR